MAIGYILTAEVQIANTQPSARKKGRGVCKWNISFKSKGVTVMSILVANYLVSVGIPERDSKVV